MTDDAVQIAMPKLLAVIFKEPGSFEKYAVNVTFFEALKALLFGDRRSGEIQDPNLSTRRKNVSLDIPFSQ